MFVRLLDEGVEVWRPVPAVTLGNGRYELVATDDYDPEIETWEFPPGAVVMGESSRDGTIRVVGVFEPN